MLSLQWHISRRKLDSLHVGAAALAPEIGRLLKTDQADSRREKHLQVLYLKTPCDSIARDQANVHTVSHDGARAWHSSLWRANNQAIQTIDPTKSYSDNFFKVLRSLF